MSDHLLIRLVEIEAALRQCRKELSAVPHPTPERREEILTKAAALWGRFRFLQLSDSSIHN